MIASPLYILIFVWLSIFAILPIFYWSHFTLSTRLPYNASISLILPTILLVEN